MITATNANVKSSYRSASRRISSRFCLLSSRRRSKSISSMMVPKRRHHRQASLSYVYRASFHTFSTSKCIRDLKGTPDQECTLDGEHASWDGSQDVSSKEAKRRNASGHHSAGGVGVRYRGDGFIPPSFVQNTQTRQKMEKDKDNTGCGASQRRATLAKNTPSGLCD